MCGLGWPNLGRRGGRQGGGGFLSRQNGENHRRFFRGRRLRRLFSLDRPASSETYSRQSQCHRRKHGRRRQHHLLANHMYNVAPKDGTVIGNFSGQIILEQLFGNPAVQYDLGQVSLPRRAHRRNLFADHDAQVRRDEAGRAARRQVEANHRRRHSRVRRWNKGRC